MEINVKNEQETLDFAAKYAQSLRPGQIIGLIGGLGAGKTVFAKGLAKGLGISQNLSSPTFNLMRLYEIRNGLADPGIKRLCHIDAYRAKSEFEIIDIGAEDFIGQKDTVTVVEWADKIRDILPGRTAIIEIRTLPDGSRLIKTDEKL